MKFKLYSIYDFVLFYNSNLILNSYFLLVLNFYLYKSNKLVNVIIKKNLIYNSLYVEIENKELTASWRYVQQDI